MSFVNTASQLLSKVPVWIYLVLFCVIVMLGQRAVIKELANANLELRLDSLNLEAKQSATRRVADSYMREAVQVKLLADSLDKALKIKPKVQIVAKVTVDTLKGRGTVLESHSDSTQRLASFSINEKLVGGKIDVSMPFDTLASPGMSYVLNFRPFLVGVNVGCRGPEALVRVKPPEGIVIGLANVSQDQSICNPATTIVKRGNRGTKLAVVAGVGLAAFYLGYAHAK